MKDRRKIIIGLANTMAQATGSKRLFLFLNSVKDCRWFLGAGLPRAVPTVIVIAKSLEIDDTDFKGIGSEVIRSWSGNQSRFSRIKYALLHGVLQGFIDTHDKVVCVLGPWERSHLDTIILHELSLSWSEEFPFDPRSLITKKLLRTVLAIVEIALDIGALGREGKPVGTTFVIGDTRNVLRQSHQAVFNPFKGYPKEERGINRPEVAESIKEFSQLDGAFVISDTGIVEAAGRHLDAPGVTTKKLRGLGSRHRAAAGITRLTGAVAVVVSESTGKVTIFEKGSVISTLEPIVSTRLA